MKFIYKHTALIEDHEITAIGALLQEYTKHLKKVATANDYKYDESSINLPFDEDLVKNVEDIKERLVDDKLKYLIDIGIGGSNRGTKAIYDAIYGYFDILEPDRFPKIIFADTNDSKNLHKLRELLKSIKDPKEVLINVISKSGGTTETIANLEMILSARRDFKERLVVTTGYKSELWNQAVEQGMITLPIPEKVGGRFSVFAADGIFPLSCVGVNIYSLLQGAMAMRSACLSSNALKNPALTSAILLYQNYKNGKTINDTFLFHPELESVGKWYRQLMGESIGKKKLGITPTVSIGSTDLHSMGQLYLGGPEDKFFTFVWSEHHGHSVKVPTNTPFPLIVKEMKGKTAEEIMSAILKGVKVAYEKQKVPFIQVELDGVNEESLGKFLQFKMIEMMYLGKLMGVNTFDQPNVESYKEETRKILGEK